MFIHPQDTLEEATALLTELESYEQSDMETNGENSEKDEEERTGSTDRIVEENERF